MDKMTKAEKSARAEAKRVKGIHKLIIKRAGLFNDSGFELVCKNCGCAAWFEPGKGAFAPRHKRYARNGRMPDTCDPFTQAAKRLERDFDSRYNGVLDVLNGIDVADVSRIGALKEYAALVEAAEAFRSKIPNIEQDEVAP